MFSRLCKNAIFPLNTSSGGGAASASGIENPSRNHPLATGSHSPPQPPPLLPRRSRSNARQSQRPDSSNFDPSDLLLRQEPPPPYWVHHHHQLLSNQSAPIEAVSLPVTVALDRAILPNDPNESESDNERQIIENGLCPDLLFTYPVAEPNTTPDQIYTEPFRYVHQINAQNAAEPVDAIIQNVSSLKLNNNDVATIQNLPPISRSASEQCSSSTLDGPQRTYTIEPCSAVAEIRPPPQHQDMGQSLSQRRPRLSLTWVLRDQQQHPTNQAHQSADSHVASNSSTNPTTSGTAERNIGVENSTNDQHTLLGKKKTPTKNKNCERLFSEKYANDDRKTDASAAIKPPAQSAVTSSGGLMFVCSRTRDVTSCLGYDSDYGESGGVCGSKPASANQRSIRSRKSEKVKRAASKLSFRDNLNNNSLAEKSIVCEKMMQSVMQFGAGDEGTSGIKSTYSEPSLSTGGVTEASHSRRHRHRRRRERNRSQRFGYEIKNVDDFLSKCSLSSPGNIPVVLSSASTLYQTRPGGYQIEIPLPLGMVVNAVFKNQNWLYVQTPHAEEGYVGYATCLPLGILPQARPTATSKPPPCWESNGDVFPKPCGNMTDSEKEIQMRGGTRSEGARTPRQRQAASNQQKIGVENPSSHIYSNNNNSVGQKQACGERHLDVLYLRATSQPKITDKTYAQLKPSTSSIKGYATKPPNSTTNHTVITTQPTAIAAGLEYAHRIRVSGDASLPNGTGDDYVLLQHRRPLQSIYQAATSASTMSVVSNKFDGSTGGDTMPAHRSLLRQTLLAITENFTSTTIAVQKGDVVTLLACRQVVDPRIKQPVQWFFVRARDGAQGYIPAEVAGHGFL